MKSAIRGPKERQGSQESLRQPQRGCVLQSPGLARLRESLPWESILRSSQPRRGCGSGWNNRAGHNLFEVEKSFRPFSQGRPATPKSGPTLGFVPQPLRGWKTANLKLHARKLHKMRSDLSHHILFYLLPCASAGDLYHDELRGFISGHRFADQSCRDQFDGLELWSGGHIGCRPGVVNEW